MAVFFLPAGTVAFWEAWVVLAIFCIPMAPSFPYWLKNDPELLERSLKTKESDATGRVANNQTMICKRWGDTPG